MSRDRIHLYINVVESIKNNDRTLKRYINLFLFLSCLLSVSINENLYRFIPLDTVYWISGAIWSKRRPTITFFTDWFLLSWRLNSSTSKNPIYITRYLFPDFKRNIKIVYVSMNNFWFYFCRAQTFSEKMSIFSI